jgi:hypothetical protein
LQLKGPHIRNLSKIYIFQGRASLSLGVVHRYMKYSLQKERRGEQCRLMEQPSRCSTRRRRVRIPPFAVGFYPSLLGPTLRRWVLPPRRWVVLSFAVGSYPSPLGFTPFVIGFYPFAVGVYALRRWVLPLRCWVLPLRRWVLPLRRWVLPLRCWVLPLRRWVLPFTRWVLPLVVGLLGWPFCRFVDVGAEEGGGGEQPDHIPQERGGRASGGDGVVKTNHDFQSCSCSSLGLSTGRSVIRRNNRWRKRTTTFVVVRFRDAPTGLLPYVGSPPGVPPRRRRFHLFVVVSPFPLPRSSIER